MTNPASVLGDNGISYRGTRFHRILPGLIFQGGDIAKGDGSGQISIYGDTFPDENFDIPHDSPGQIFQVNFVHFKNTIFCFIAFSFRSSDTSMHSVIKYCPVSGTQTKTSSIYRPFRLLGNSAKPISNSFFNWPTPASFSFIFGLFKQPIQFLQQINVKNVQVSIQYMAPGFEPKPYEHDLSPTTTRSGLPPNPL